MTPSLSPSKLCTGCRVVLPRAEFSLRRKGSSYVTSKCKACSSEIARAWRQANPERHSANYKKWVKSDPERHARRVRDWRSSPENANKHRGWALRWAQCNPEQRRAIMATRRARVRDARVGQVTGEDLKKLLRLQGSLCYYCHEPLLDGIKRHLEHRTPLARGGQHTIENLCWSCPTCNLRKGRKTEAEFMVWMGRAA